MDEGKAVAAAAGVDLHEDPWEMNVHATQRGSAHRPSMLEDVDARQADRGRLDQRRARARGRAARRFGAAPHGDVRARPREGGVVLVRVCVVGCGAVGSLFAANLAQLDDVEVWAYDLSQAHVDAINANGLRLDGRGRRRRTSDARRPTPPQLPPCDFGIVATKAMHTDGAIAATAHAFADGAVASVQNGVGNEEVVARHVARVIRGTTFPAGKILEPGVVQWDVKGDTTLGPFEPSPRRTDEIERLADACTRGGMPTQRSRTRAPRSGAR